MAAKNTNLNETAQAWADIVIEKWETAIQQLGIGDYESDHKHLLDSFQSSVVKDSAGNPGLIIFTFNYYGKFVDMGVGRGQKYGETGNRVAKPWYSKLFFSQVKKLAGIYAVKYGELSQLAIIENIEG